MQGIWLMWCIRSLLIPLGSNSYLLTGGKLSCLVEAISLGLDQGGLGAEYLCDFTSLAKVQTGMDGSYNPFSILKSYGFNILNILTIRLIIHQYLIHIVKPKFLSM